MSIREDRIAEALWGLVHICNSNFPVPTYVTITVEGENRATVRLNGQEFTKLLMGGTPKLKGDTNV